VEQPVNGLTSGESVELELPGVYLKKGTHKLSARVRLILIKMFGARPEYGLSYITSKTIRVSD
jgi:hypothetical protein